MKKLMLIAFAGIVLTTACQQKSEPATPVEPATDSVLVEPTPLDTMAGYALFELPYAYNALEPYMDAQTVALHYEKHTKGYFNKLISGLRGTEWQGKTLEEIFAQADKASDVLLKNGGQVYNHEIFFNIMSADSTSRTPSPELTEAINRDFGSMEALKTQFMDVAKGVFGSGWAFLSKDKQGKLFVSAAPNHMNPMMNTMPQQGKPIMACDVWEHSYYLKYQNRRPEYLEAFWSVIDWREVSRRFAN